MPRTTGTFMVRHIAKFVGVVGVGKDGFAQVLAHFGIHHIEGSGELDIPHMISTQVDVHQAGDLVIILGIFVELDALHQR